MEERIKAYLDSLFSNVPDSTKAREIKQEMLQNLLEKYEDLVAEGKAPEAAYQLTVDSIGDVSSLIAELSMERAEGFREADPFASYQGANSYNGDPSGQRQQTYQQNTYQQSQANPYTTGNGQAPKKSGPPAWAIALLVVGSFIVLIWILATTVLSQVFRAVRRSVNSEFSIQIDDAELGDLDSLLEDLTSDLSEEGIHITFSGEGEATTGETFAVGEIEKVEIHWVSGNIDIYKGEAVSFSVESSQALKDGEETCYKVEGKTLIIDEYRSGLSIDSKFTLGTFNLPKKDLKITLPEGLSDLEIDVVSADIDFEEPVYVDTIRINSVSSDVEAEDLSCATLKVDTVSGNVSVSLLTMPGTIDFDCVSGNLTLELPQNCPGFSVKKDSVSGNLKVEDFAGTVQESGFEYGDGSTRITFDSVSGDLTIRMDD